MGAIDEQFVSSDKAQASTLMAKLCSMRLKGTQNVRGHIMEMRDVSAQLKALDVDFSESFLVHCSSVYDTWHATAKWCS